MTEKQVAEWYVIIGIPSSGKTTLIEHFRKLGYATSPEGARMVIDEEISKGVKPADIFADNFNFQQKVLHKKMSLEDKAPKRGPVFMDSGVPCGIAYSKVNGTELGDLPKYSNRRYLKVFYLQPLPFERDYARLQTEEQLKILDKLIPDTYRKLGYTVITVPVAPVEERAKLILSHL